LVIDNEKELVMERFKRGDLVIAKLPSIDPDDCKKDFETCKEGMACGIGWEPKMYEYAGKLGKIDKYYKRNDSYLVDFGNTYWVWKNEYVSKLGYIQGSQYSEDSLGERVIPIKSAIGIDPAYITMLQIKELSLSPNIKINNDNRENCYDCGGQLRKLDTGFFKIMKVCTVCEK
jgi:hypothetical protein